MGFNIEEYELGENYGYSNISGNDALRGAGTICVKGNPVYGIPLTYAGFQMTKKGREKISENRQICQARYFGKQDASQTSSSVAIDAPKTDVSTSSQSNAPTQSRDIAPLSATSDVAKSNKGLYIGIGVGVLAIGIATIILLTRKK